MRKITKKELKKILEAHKKWVESGGKEGVRAALRYSNLSNADLSNANLINAGLSSANLSGANLINAKLNRANLSSAKLISANLSNANLSEAKLNSASLFGANLYDAKLIGANLSGASLVGANLSGANLVGANLYDAKLFEANLSGANLKGTDLSNAILFKTELREEDLIGARYSPEQLKDMIIERPEREPIMAPDQKGTLTIHFAKEDPPLLHFIYLSAFLEYQYDVFYIFLFSQYESIDKLRDSLTGSPFHWLKDKDEAVKIVRMSTQSPPTIEFLGQLPIFAFIYGLYLATPKGIKDDLYKCIRQAIWKTKKDKLEEELLKAKVEDKQIEIEKKKLEVELLKADMLKKNAEKIKECRDVGVAPADIIPPGKEKETLPQAFQPEGPSKLTKIIEDQKDNITTRPPRIDYYKTILLLRQEGMLTNKLDDKALANLLEIIMEKAIHGYQSTCKETGNFEVDLKKEDEKKEE